VTDPQDDQHTHGGGVCPTCVRYGARAAAQEAVRLGAAEASKVWEAKIPAMLDEARAEVAHEVHVALSATHGSLGDVLDVLDRYSAAAGGHE
jgi:hypothetical protein